MRPRADAAHLKRMARKPKGTAGRIRKPIGTIALVGLCAAFAGSPVLSQAVGPIPVYADSTTAGGEKKQTGARIAVVNMDEGVVVDGKPVRYSDQIVSLPDTGNYTFATLAEAQTGIDTGKFTGYVLIPTGFSRTVISINSKPDPCEIQYFINKALEKEDVYASLQAVYAFKDKLSDSMSYMYVNNILEEFHTAQDSAGTVLENDRTDLAAANAIQSAGILPGVTFSEMAVPADTTTPLNAAAYITRNAEILSSISQDYSAKDSEVASQVSALQQAGAGLATTLTSLTQESSGILDGVSGIALDDAVTGAQTTVENAKTSVETVKSVTGEDLNTVGGQYTDSVTQIREAVKAANEDTQKDAEKDVKELVERLMESVPGIAVQVSSDGQSCTITPDSAKEEEEELPEIRIVLEDPDRETAEDNAELMRLILSIVYQEKDNTTVITTTEPAQTGDSTETTEGGTDNTVTTDGTDGTDVTVEPTEPEDGSGTKEPEMIETETILEATIKDAIKAADADPNVQEYLAKTGYSSAEEFMAAADAGTLVLTSKAEMVIKSDEKDLEAFRDYLVAEFDPDKEAESFRLGYVDAYERDEEGNIVTGTDGEKTLVYETLSQAFTETLSSVQTKLEEGMDGLGSQFDGITNAAAALTGAAADIDSAVSAAKTGIQSNGAAETEAVGAFQTEVAGVNAASMDASGMTENINALNTNYQSYEEAVMDSNQSYITYAGNVVTIANENIARLRDDVTAADTAAETAIEETIAAFKAQKAQTSAQNQALLEAFTTKLAYTRLGALPYTDAYRFIASPLTAADTSKQAPVSVAPSTSSSESKAQAPTSTPTPETRGESTAVSKAGPETKEASIASAPAASQAGAGTQAIPYIAGIAGVAAAGAGILFIKKRKH